MNNKRIAFLTSGAAIAAMYVVLTILANAFGLANYQIQVRFSEALTVLPYFTPAAIPGLFIGCLLSNYLTGAHIIDIAFGSLATLAAAYWSYKLRGFKNKYIVCLPPIICNTIVVPFVLKIAYGIVPVWLSAVFVCLGEVISAGIMGIGLIIVVEKTRLSELLSA